MMEKDFAAKFGLLNQEGKRAVVRTIILLAKNDKLADELCQVIDRNLNSPTLCSTVNAWLDEQGVTE